MAHIFHRLRHKHKLRLHMELFPVASQLRVCQPASEEPLPRQAAQIGPGLRLNGIILSPHHR